MCEILSYPPTVISGPITWFTRGDMLGLYAFNLNVKSLSLGVGLLV